MEALVGLASGDVKIDALDALGRPSFFSDHLAHHGCARNEYYEYKASAETVSQLGCLMEHHGRQSGDNYACGQHSPELRRDLVDAGLEQASPLSRANPGDRLGDMN
jgi:hypothetical protein